MVGLTFVGHSGHELPIRINVRAEAEARGQALYSEDTLSVRGNVSTYHKAFDVLCSSRAKGILCTPPIPIP